MTTQTRRIAFIGLGAMGFPMAGHLARAGHTVTVYNRTPARAQAWHNVYGGKIAATPAEAAAGQDAVMLCVGNDDDVLAVSTSDLGVLQTLPAGALLIDHTTTSESLAKSLAETARERQVRFLDAPVSGGQIGAEKGALTVMVGADEADYRAALPLIECYAKCVRHMGPHGTGQLTKMVNQICIAGLVQGLSEGINFAQRAGLDVGSVVDTISKGAAGSWQMENRAQTMADGVFDYGFALDWMRKDLRICFEEAAANGSALPVTEIVDGYYEQLQELGLGRWDTSTLIHLLRQE